MLGLASAAARVVLQAKGSRRVVTAVDIPMPCLAASVADVSKGAGALSVALTLVIEVVAHAAVRAGARRLSAVAM